MKYKEHLQLCYKLSRVKDKDDRLRVGLLSEESYVERQYEIYRKAVSSLRLSKKYVQYRFYQGKVLSIVGTEDSKKENLFLEEKVKSPLLVFLINMFVSTIGLISSPTRTSNMLDEQFEIRGLSKIITNNRIRLKRDSKCEKTKQIVQNEREYYEELKYINLLFSLIRTLEENHKLKNEESSHKLLINYFSNMYYEIENYYYDSYSITTEEGGGVENIKLLADAYMRRNNDEIEEFKMYLNENNQLKKSFDQYLKYFHILKPYHFNDMRNIIIQWWLPIVSIELVDKIENELKEIIENKKIIFNRGIRLEATLKAKEEYTNIDDSIVGLSEFDMKMIDAERIIMSRGENFINPPLDNRDEIGELDLILSYIKLVNQNRISM